MKIMRKLLHNLGDVWNALPKEVPFLSIQKGTGTHTMVTVDEGALYFHSRPYTANLPQKQEVILDDLTTAELIDVIGSMGYTVELTSEAIEKGLDVHKPFVLMEVENVPLDTELNAFTSNVWKTLYPIYRVLRKAEFDIDVALKQLYRDIAKGDWLDYWASFFAIERERGETDNDFIRRFTMWLFNPKTNNVAIKELLAYRLKDTNIEVADVAPNQFELTVGTKYIEDASDLHNILAETKAAGVEYFLRYLADVYEEDYKMWLSDITGRPFSENDDGWVSLQKSISEDPFPEILEGAAVELMASHAESFPIPSEEFMGFRFGKTFEEYWVNPSEDLAYTLQAIYEDAFPTPTDSVAKSTLSKDSEEVYTGLIEQTNIDGAFALVDSELVEDELYGMNGLSSFTDVATITLTVNGEVVRSVTI